MKKYYKTNKNRTNTGNDAVSGIIGFPFNLWLWENNFKRSLPAELKSKVDRTHFVNGAAGYEYAAIPKDDD